MQNVRYIDTNCGAIAKKWLALMGQITWAVSRTNIAMPNANGANDKFFPKRISRRDAAHSTKARNPWRSNPNWLDISCNMPNRTS